MRDTSKPSMSRAGSLPLVGGVLALDFCNTSSGRGTVDHQEHLRTAADLVAWAHHSAILDATAEAHLQRLCELDPPFAARLLARALDLRDAVYRVDAAMAHGRTVDQSDMDIVATIHAACLTKARLITTDGAFGWTWNVETAPEDVVIGPIAVSAMAIIMQADKGRLKQCQGHHCGWLFIDTTKANNRRWCEMEVCGNRAKQKRRRSRSEA